MLPHSGVAGTFLLGDSGFVIFQVVGRSGTQIEEEQPTQEKRQTSRETDWLHAYTTACSHAVSQLRIPVLSVRCVFGFGVSLPGCNTTIGGVRGGIARITPKCRVGAGILSRHRSGAATSGS